MIPFREEDELEQFRLIVEQLEVCRDLVLAEVASKSRMALILLDNTAEVMLYRISCKAFEHDKMARRIRLARFSPKQRKAIEYEFERKLGLAETDDQLDATSVEMLRVLHRYRNAAFHRDAHKPSVIPILARLAFVAVSRLFVSVRGGIAFSLAGGFAKQIDWLTSYGLTGLYIDYQAAAQQISQRLRTGIEVSAQTAAEQLARDLGERLNSIRQVLSRESPLGNDTGRINETLKWFEFREEFPDLEYNLSEKYRSFVYKIGLGSGDEVSRDEFVAAEKELHEKYQARFALYEPKLKCERLARVDESIGSLRRMTGFDEILTAYAREDKALTSYERSVYAALRNYESQVQMETDIGSMPFLVEIANGPV